MASFKCKDIGMKCSFEVKDENPDEILAIAALHAEKTHNIKPPFPAEMTDKLKKAIKK